MVERMLTMFGISGNHVVPGVGDFPGLAATNGRASALGVRVRENPGSRAKTTRRQL